VREFLDLAPGEEVVALCPLGALGLGGSAGIALGTAQGVVKRVLPEVPANRDAWDVVALRDGDRVVGAATLSSGREDLVFVTSDAQLLRFGADAVRPQGRAAGGMAGVRLAPGASVLAFAAVPEGSDGSDAVVVTVTGGGDAGGAALPGTAPPTAKVTAYAEFPAKGRATGGVRCHRFLRGEDRPDLAWVGLGPAVACSPEGAPVDLPPVDRRRDGSGLPLAAPVAAVSGARQDGGASTRV